MDHDRTLGRPRSNRRRPEAAPRQRAERHQSGIVPAGTGEQLPTALTLQAPRPEVIGFGASLASGDGILVVSGRLEERHPFAALYRITSEGAVRERLLRGASSHLGPQLAAEADRVAVGQPSADGGTGFVSVYRRRNGELVVETTIEGLPGTPAGSRFGERLALGADLLVLGQAASVCVYRHSPVGWLADGELRPEPAYSWNPRFGASLGVVRGRVLVGNPVEISGHRAGPGRVYVYRQADDSMVLEGLLRGDGIEFGRSEQPLFGFGASIEVAGDLVLIAAPYELLADGTRGSRVYVFRVAKSGALARVGSVPVPGCEGGMCVVGDRLFVLGDALHVLARAGNSFTMHASYPLDDPQACRLAACGRLLAIGRPQGAGEVTLHFADLL